MGGELSDREIDAFLEGGEPNVPERVPGHPGSKDPSPRLSSRESRLRREVVGELLATGVSRDEIVDLLADPSKTGLAGPVGEVEVGHLIEEVRAEWQEEDAERSKFYKAAAIRRLNKHIMKARAAGSWQAVANLEKVLMMIQGTAEPIEVSQPGGTRLSEALLQVLNEADPREVRRLIESERAVVAGGERVVKLLPPTGEQKR